MLVIAAVLISVLVTGVLVVVALRLLGRIKCLRGA